MRLAGELLDFKSPRSTYISQPWLPSEVLIDGTASELVGMLSESCHRAIEAGHLIPHRRIVILQHLSHSCHVESTVIAGGIQTFASEIVSSVGSAKDQYFLFLREHITLTYRWFRILTALYWYIKEDAVSIQCFIWYYVHTCLNFRMDSMLLYDTMCIICLNFRMMLYAFHI